MYIYMNVQINYNQIMNKYFKTAFYFLSELLSENR